MTYGEAERGKEEKTPLGSACGAAITTPLPFQSVVLAEKKLLPPVYAMTSAFKVQKAAFFFDIMQKNGPI